MAIDKVLEARQSEQGKANDFAVAKFIEEKNKAHHEKYKENEGKWIN